MSFFFFFSSRRRHTRFSRDWSSDVCSSDLRLVCALEEQIVTDTTWTVFEPNGPVLWAQVVSVVRGLLEQVWRKGMLNGATSGQAYTVTCDASVNPPSDVAAGKLTCL